MDLRQLQEEYINDQRKVTEEKIQVGALFRTILSEEDGLIFRNGRTQKPKRLIIIGFDRDIALCYGSILVNTSMSPKADFSDEVRAAQYLLKHSDYPEFLDYDSFVDCGIIFKIPFAKLLNGEYFGLLNEADQNAIFDILETTETLSTKEKKRYGIRRRSSKL
ncbi:MAG: hypothetical protein IJZ70_03400 [Bacteroidales bacterium]|nr:hypothetical protein [Bacteroidales bacterium]MBQ8811340.1 hypothetical protein [Bacteroidales bacterium]